MPRASKPLWKSEAKSILLKSVCPLKARYRSVVQLSDDPTQLATQLAKQMLPAIAIAAPIVVEKLRPSIEHLINVVGESDIVNKLKEVWKTKELPPLQKMSMLNTLQTIYPPSQKVVAEFY